MSSAVRTVCDRIGNRAYAATAIFILLAIVLGVAWTDMVLALAFAILAAVCIGIVIGTELIAHAFQY